MIMKKERKKLFIVVLVLGLAGISPNLFPAAQAGYAGMSFLATHLLIPSVVLIFLLVWLSSYLKYEDVKKQILNGILAGVAGTVALEIVRETGFRLGGMPGDMPKLLGVLLLNRFAYGPNIWSNLAGWAYHFWNGAAFGIIFSLLFGQGKPWKAILYGIFIGTGFMISPATTSLGIGILGLEFKDGYQFLITVILAHIAFGGVMGWVIYRVNAGLPDVVKRLKLKV